MALKHLESVACKRRETAAIVDELPDVLQFMQLLWAVVHGLERTSKRMTTELGVTGPQRLVLRVVGLFPGMSAGDLAAILHVHPSTLTGVLRRLSEQGLLLRVSDVQDRRRAILRLSPAGQRVNAGANARTSAEDCCCAASVARQFAGGHAEALNIEPRVTQRC
jgi:MarR family transcriptional regulator, organic hydroperoxide resistance regulator